MSPARQRAAKAIFRLLLGWAALSSAACGARGFEVRAAETQTAPAPVLETSRAPVEAVPDGSGRLSSADRLQGILWRFRAGSPVGGAPAVAPDGTVYVGSADGSLHALAGDGSFRWSISLNGAVLGSPSVGSRGTVYAATANGQVSALRQDGTLLWSLRPPMPPATGVVLGPKEQLYFAGRDGALYAVSSHGGVLPRRSFAQGISVGPIAERSEIVLGTKAGELILFGSSERPRRFGFPRALEAVPALGPAAAYVIAGDELFSVDLSGRRQWSASGFRSLGAGEHGIVACSSGGELVWFTLDGRIEHRARLPTAPSGSPRVTSSGSVLVPSEDGRLLVFSAGGRLERDAVIARAPVVGITLDAARARALVAAGDGAIAALYTALESERP